MLAIGVKALKARLSEYLRLVKGGETILVTERDTVIAELRPSRQQAPAPSSLEAHLRALADEGKATLRTNDDMTNWGSPGPPLNLPGISSAEILDELREDSR